MPALDAAGDCPGLGLGLWASLGLWAFGGGCPYVG